MAKREVYGWHFTGADKRLGHGDGREVRLGETLTVAVKPVLCEVGLHASERLIDALSYAQGPVVWWVRLENGIVPSNRQTTDKHAAKSRTAVAGGVEITEALREFIVDTLVYRRPHVVKLLERINLAEEAQAVQTVEITLANIKEVKRIFQAAWDAARDAAWDAAWAAWDAARDAARDDLNIILTRRVAVLIWPDGNLPPQLKVTASA